MFFVACIAVMIYTADIVQSNECSYNGNICDADAQCLGEITDGYRCYEMSHSKLHKSYSPRKFSVNISDMSSYLEDVTVTILRVYKDEYTTVPGCCDLKSNQVCMLPPSDDAEYVIVAPIIDVEYDFLSAPPFCCFPVDDRDEFHLKWCHVNKTAPCKYVKDDMIYVNETHKEVSTDSWQKSLTYDLCLFDAPIMESDGFRYFHGDGLSYGVKNVEEKSEEICTGKGGKIKQNLNRREYLDEFKERAPPGYTRCAFEKEIGFSSFPSWSVRPNCHIHGTAKPFPVWSIVVVAITIALILIFTLCMIYKRYADSWFPEYKISLQLNEGLSSFAETPNTEKDTEAKKDTEEIDTHEEISTLERYSRMPVRLGTLPKMIYTKLTFQNNENIAKSEDNILWKSDYSENEMTVDDVPYEDEGFPNAGFCYFPKHFDTEELYTTEKNVNFSDFNGNNIPSEYIAKDENLNNIPNVFRKPMSKSTAFESCILIDTKQYSASAKDAEIRHSKLYKTMPMRCVHNDLSKYNCKEGVYVKKYDKEPV